MTRHLVIFARAPQMGRVKRRLAEGIGVTAALHFHRTTLARQIMHLARDRRWTTWLFVTPDGSRGHPAWRGVVRSRVIPQRRGDLGQRMKRPFQILPPGPVILVGSDIPAMRPDHIACAFRSLGEHDFVFGPARDGGYWLIGSRRMRPLPHGLFARVRWSTPHALADTLATIPARFSTGLVDRLDDIDDAQDLRRFRASAKAAS